MRENTHKAKGIKLAVLREIRAEDLGGCRQLRIGGGVHGFHAVFFLRGPHRMRFTDFLSDEVNKRPPTNSESGRLEVKTLPDGWSSQVDGGPLMPFDYIVTTYDLHTHRIPIKVTSDRIAEPVMIGLRDDDIIIFGNQIERRKIDAATGEIV
jgi:hypothetical protein